MAIFVALAVVALTELLLFRTYHQENVAPYFPRMWDQTATFEHVYRAHYVIQEKGLAEAVQRGGPLADLAFKSSLVPAVGTLLTFLFGPNRFAVGLVNFLIFIAAQVVVVRTLYRLRGPTAAAIGWGLLLLSQSHWINGLFDLRFDYAGLLAFGLAWVAIVTYLASPGRRTLVGLILALLFCAAARSISQVYALVTSAIIFGGTLVGTLASRFQPTWKMRLRSAGVVLATSGSIITAYTASQWLTLRGYYGSQIGTLAGEIRWAEVGVVFLKDRLIWYPLNWWPHFSKLSLVALGVVMANWVAWVLLEARRPKVAPDSLRPDPLPWPWSAPGLLAMLVAASLAVFVSSPLVGPNIAVLGMLTLPTAITLALAVDWSARLPRRRSFPRLAVSLVAGLGFLDWTDGIATAREINFAWRERGEVGQKLLEVLARNVEMRRDPGVAFLWTHDIYNPESLLIFQVESRHRLPSPIRSFLPGLIELTPGWFDHVIARSNCVVGYIKPPALLPGQYEWPAVTSVRKYQPHWQSILDREFVLADRWQQPSEQAELGVWVRKVSFGAIDFPGVETPDGVPAFWLRPEPFALELINATERELSVVLQAPAWPGAGREETAEVELEATSGGGEIFHARLNAANRFGVRIPLTLKPGLNQVWLSARDAGDTRLAPSGLPIFLPELSIKTL